MLQAVSSTRQTADVRHNAGPSTGAAIRPLMPIAALGNQAMLRLQRKCACGGETDCDCDSTADHKKKETGGPKTALHRKPSGLTASAGDTAAKNDGAASRALPIGPSNDPLEHEADQMAERVMRMPHSAISAKT